MTVSTFTKEKLQNGDASINTAHLAALQAADRLAQTISPYTQTYATAARTVPNMTCPAITLADGVGTNDGAIPAITNNASTIVAVQELAAAVNALAADVLAAFKLINAVIDDKQSIETHA